MSHLCGAYWDAMRNVIFKYDWIPHHHIWWLWIPVQYLGQSWEFAHSLIAHLLISLKSNERLWPICSDCSRKISDRERIAEVTQDKWATMSNLLRSLRGNEWMSDLLNKFWLTKSKILFYNNLCKVFQKKNFNKMSESLIFAHFLFFGKQCEWITRFAQIKWAMWAHIAPFAHQKWATMIDSLRSLKGNERCERIAHIWTKNERFARKSNERIPSPDLGSWQHPRAS